MTTETTDTIKIESLKRVDLMSAFTQQPPPLEYVLPGMLTGTVGALVAAGGVGKSWVALQLAMAVAGGPDLLEVGIQSSGQVLYLPAEDPEIALEHRLYDAGPQLDDTAMRVIAGNLEIIPLMGRSVDLLAPAWADAILRLSEGKRLVVIDTLRRFHTGDENNGGDMAHLLSVMERICERTGCAILFLHHTAKAAAMNGGGDQQQASRGSSVLVDNVRGGQLNIVGMTEAEAKAHGVDPDDRRRFVRLIKAKVNYGEAAGDIWLRRCEGGILLPAGIERVTRDRQEAKASTKPQRRERGRV
jgi:RecA-family ATPase